MDGCKSSIKKITVLLKERITSTSLSRNKHNTSKTIAQIMDGCKVNQNKFSILQKIDDYHSFWDRNIYPSSTDRWLQVE